MNKDPVELGLEIYKDSSLANNGAIIRERDKFENLFFLLTSGTITLSITFLSDTLSKNKFEFACLLIYSIISLSISLLINMISFYFVNKHFRVYEKELDDWLKKVADENKLSRRPGDNKWTKLTNISNGITIFFGLIGMILFIIFGLKLIMYFQYSV